MARPKHGGNLQWAASIAGCSPSAILDFSASINPLGPPQSAVLSIQAQLPWIRDYPDPTYGQVRSRLAQIHAVPPEWILPGNGSAELLTWAGWDLAKLEATYLVTPAFSDYFRALNAFDATVMKCPLNEAGLGVQLAGLDFKAGSVFDHEGQGLSSLDPKFSRCGLLLNNPHNPTGQLLSRAAILPLLKRFELVVIDEAFMDFLPHEQDSLIGDVQQYPNLVILRSLTKFYSVPGLRFGYAIAHPTRLNEWQTRRDPWSVNTFAAAAAEACIQDKAFQTQTFGWLEAARPELFDGLSQFPDLSPLPSVANYFLVKVNGSASNLQHKLLKRHKILIRDCLSFPELGDRYFRVAVRLRAENQRLIQGLADIL
ncbi:threonine-phosphate decarboxylase CobD [Myxacorys almedinensis]|uniref:threonine-phosphate decarboxylase n=1 Tax=Myxacorys almedinensis A TaxID=2690445 RepID=A0A8J8CIH7_9CYAN|nr:threonine-phosphate decarboxylase CobD [Myxacorys almedinensis]NDJ17823.1 threonine-phosphate decarboxylase [Myxacorys almedinensis A]